MKPTLKGWGLSKSLETKVRITDAVLDAAHHTLFFILFIFLYDLSSGSQSNDFFLWPLTSVSHIEFSFRLGMCLLFPFCAVFLIETYLKPFHLFQPWSWVGLFTHSLCFNVVWVTFYILPSVSEASLISLQGTVWGLGILAPFMHRLSMVSGGRKLSWGEEVKHLNTWIPTLFWGRVRDPVSHTSLLLGQGLYRTGSSSTGTSC